MPHTVWNSPACLQLWHWSPKAITKRSSVAYNGAAGGNS